MIKVKNPNVGDRVIGQYIGPTTGKIEKYKGKIININKDGTRLSILRDDGEEGSGIVYKGNYTWSSKKRWDGFWGGSGPNKFLYRDTITNWKDRLR